jgi:glycosyltransferase involved in cell wall biosynthesis
MRVLLSAYACEPGKGSEPEVGWQRALHMLALADEVWVLTRSNNQVVIESDPLSSKPGLHFLYYDLPPWVLLLKKQAWLLPLYFILWQWGAYRLAAKRHRVTPFDRVYHVTFASMQYGSFMGRLGVPFVIGPIAGGERAPLRLRRSMPIRCKVTELLRDIGIMFQRYSPLTCPAFAAADHIYVATADSLRLVPPKWRYKTSVHLAIATASHTVQNDERRPPGLPRFIFSGRLLHWKGVHFAIRALAEVRRAIPAATLTLIGSGPDEQWLRDMATKCGVADAVEFAGYLPRHLLVASINSYTAFIYPSLHDSGGFAVLESLQEGTPVVCLDLGGPGIIVNPSCGIVIPTADADEAQIVTSIANAMISLGRLSDTELKRLSAGARVRINKLSWSSLTQHISAFQSAV